MGDKIRTRGIDFNADSIKRLTKLADQRGQVFEDYVSEMIERFLIEILEDEQSNFDTEELTDGELENLSKNRLKQLYELKDSSSVPEVDEDEIFRINGHTRSFFPLIVIVRSLMQVIIRTGKSYIPYSDYRSEIFDIATRLKKSLIMAEIGPLSGFYERGLIDSLPWIPYEEGLSGERKGNSRRTNSSITDRVKRSETWFHQYYSNARLRTKNPGILLMLGLVHVRINEGITEITLTQAGIKLALIGDNPILDQYLEQKIPASNIKNTLSEDEQAMLIERIQLRCAEEAKRMYSVLEFIDKNYIKYGEGVSRKEIELAIYDGIILNFSNYQNKHSMNMGLSGILGRLSDLGLVTDGTYLTRPGRIKRYKVTNRDKFPIL